MRVLIVDREFPPHPHGGIGTYHLNLARALGERGHRVVVLSWTGRRRWECRRQPYGSVLRFPYRPPPARPARLLSWVDPLCFGWQSRSALALLAQSSEFDVVELPSTGGYGWGALQVFRGRAPVVTRFHGCLGRLPADENAAAALRDELRRAGIRPGRFGAARRLQAPTWQLERHQAAGSAQLSFPSTFAQRWLAGQMGRPGRPGSIIPNGVDLTALRQSGRFTGKSWRAGQKLVTYAGRCTISKGATVLARAAPVILSHEPNTVVALAGPLSDPRVALIFQRLADLFPGRVRLMGRLPHRALLALLAASALLVHPSFYEICPMAVLEAQGLGVPVIASDCGPLPELVLGGMTGLLFPPGDSITLADSVLALLGSAETRQGMGETARIRVEREFEIGRIVDRLVAFYQGLGVPAGGGRDEIP